MVDITLSFQPRKHVSSHGEIQGFLSSSPSQRPRLLRDEIPISALSAVSSILFVQKTPFDPNLYISNIKHMSIRQADGHPHALVPFEKKTSRTETHGEGSLSHVCDMMELSAVLFSKASAFPEYNKYCRTRQKLSKTLHFRMHCPFCAAAGWILDTKYYQNIIKYVFATAGGVPEVLRINFIGVTYH